MSGVQSSPHIVADIVRAEPGPDGYDPFFHVAFERSLRAGHPHLAGRSGTDNVECVSRSDVVVIIDDSNTVVECVLVGIEQADIARLTIIILRMLHQPVQIGINTGIVNIVDILAVKANRTLVAAGAGLGFIAIVAQAAGCVNASWLAAGHPVQKVKIVTAFGDPQAAAVLAQSIPATKKRSAAEIILVRRPHRVVP